MIDIYPILTSYSCSSCHSPGSYFPNLSTEQNAFTDITAGGSPLIDAITSSSRFYIAVTSAYAENNGPMPGGAPYLTANEQAKGLAWISQGAKP